MSADLFAPHSFEAPRRNCLINSFHCAASGLLLVTQLKLIAANRVVAKFFNRADSGELRGGGRVRRRAVGPRRDNVPGTVVGGFVERNSHGVWLGLR